MNSEKFLLNMMELYFGLQLMKGNANGECIQQTVSNKHQNDYYNNRIVVTINAKIIPL